MTSLTRHRILCDGTGSLSIVRCLYWRLKSSLLAKTLLLAGSISALTAAALIVLALATSEQKARERLDRKLHELIDAAGASAGQACFAGDRTLGQDIVQVIVKNDDIHRVEIRCGDVRLAVAERQAAAATATTDPPVVRALFSPLYAYEQIGEMAVTPDGQAIDSAAARDVGELGLMLMLFGAGILIAIGLSADAMILRPVRVISKQLRSCEADAGVCVVVPPPHADNVLGRLVGEVNDLFHRLRSSMRQECERHLQRTIEEKLKLAASAFEHWRNDDVIVDPDWRRPVSADSAAQPQYPVPVHAPHPGTPDQSTGSAGGQRLRAGEEAASWRLDMTSWRLAGPGDGVAPLTHAETAFLAALAKSPGQPVSREELITAMGHRSEYYDRRRLDTFVSRLRKKVVTGCGAQLPLRSIHAYGYSLAVPIHLAQS